MNKVGDADCTVTFEGNDPSWKFSVAHNETATKFFLFGSPPITDIVCTSGGRAVSVEIEGAPVFDGFSGPCPADYEGPYTITLIDPAKEERAFC